MLNIQLGFNKFILNKTNISNEIATKKYSKQAPEEIHMNIYL